MSKLLLSYNFSYDLVLIVIKNFLQLSPGTIDVISLLEEQTANL